MGLSHPVAGIISDLYTRLRDPGQLRCGTPGRLSHKDSVRVKDGNSRAAWCTDRNDAEAMSLYGNKLVADAGTRCATCRRRFRCCRSGKNGLRSQDHDAC